jgi:enoyl-CoA hydratase
MDPVVILDKIGAVYKITISRPKALNALSAQVIEELATALSQVESDAGCRAVVLCGAGEKAFVAGADIAAMREMSPADAEAFATKGQALGDHIARLAVPVIAAVQGFALGGGCELAMACDIVVAGANAKFGQPEVKLGVIPGFGGTQRLVRRVGLAVAMDLCLTGRMIDVDEALRIGLVSRKVDGDVTAAAMSVAAEVVAMGPGAVRLCKRAILDYADADVRTGLAAERALFALCFASADQKEGMAAFLERRTAMFTGT